MLWAFLKRICVPGAVCKYESGGELARDLFAAMRAASICLNATLSNIYRVAIAGSVLERNAKVLNNFIINFLFHFYLKKT